MRVTSLFGPECLWTTIEPERKHPGTGFDLSPRLVTYSSEGPERLIKRETRQRD